MCWAEKTFIDYKLLYWDCAQKKKTLCLALHIPTLLNHTVKLAKC